MRQAAAPFQFLLLVVFGWAGLRATALSYSSPTPQSTEATAAAVHNLGLRPSRSRAPDHRPRLRSNPPKTAPPPAALATSPATASVETPPAYAQRSPFPLELEVQQRRDAAPGVSQQAREMGRARLPAPLPLQPRASPSSRRLAGSAWLFTRSGGDIPLSLGGTLGGSQAGARVTYRMAGTRNRPLAISGRVYAPLDNLRAGEVGAGLDWKPFANLPLHLLAERREALGKDGRSAFMFTTYGGLSDHQLGHFRIDAYAQAGVVGVQAKDLFADGSLRLAYPVGGFKVGAGLWGTVQPGIHRLDAGPHLQFRIPGKGTSLLLSADWRFRLMGDAKPASGPALTIAADF